MKKIILWLIFVYLAIGIAFASQYYFSYKYKPVTSYPNNLSTFTLNTLLWPLNDLTPDSYINCLTATTTDDNQNEYIETKCEFRAIHTGDAFLADIGHGKEVIFTYNGTPSGSKPSEFDNHLGFDTEQENAWEYKIVGSTDTPKKLTFKLWDEHKDFSEVSGFSFRDLNFDGYLDLIEGVRQGAGANFWSGIFWFDPATDTFVAPDTSSDGSVFDVLVGESNFDLKNKTYSYYGTSGADRSYTYEYTFLNGEWTLTQTWHSEPDDTGKYCVGKERNLINGKMVEKETYMPRYEDEHC